MQQLTRQMKTTTQAVKKKTACVYSEGLRPALISSSSGIKCPKTNVHVQIESDEEIAFAANGNFGRGSAVSTRWCNQP
jgi:hypothetical protein